MKKFDRTTIEGNEAARNHGDSERVRLREEGESMSKHTWYKCQQPCTKLHCMFCDGGLGYCTVCKGFEGTLPSECPGKEMNEEVQDGVYHYGLDYKNGCWQFPEIAPLRNRAGGSFPVLEEL